MYVRTNSGLGQGGGFRVRATRPQQHEPPDLRSVVERCLNLLKDPQKAGYELKYWPRVRLVCLMQKMLRLAKGENVEDNFLWLQFEFDDRGVRKAGVPPKLRWSRVRANLTLPMVSGDWSFGPWVSDKKLLENLETLDRFIYQGRYYINNQFIVGGATGGGSSIGPEIRKIRDWLEAQEQEKNVLSIYNCHKG
jgi:hypothetical protein